MFDGTFKSTRKISLSGRKKPLFGTTPLSVGASSKHELLLQSKAAREERVLHRQQTQASIKIQAQARRFLTTQNTRRGVLQQLEQALTTLVAGGDRDLRMIGVPYPTLRVFLRQLLFVYGNGNGRERREEVRRRLQNAQNYVMVAVLQSVLRGSRADQTNYLAAPKDDTWMYQTVRLLELALDNVVECGSAAEAGDDGGKAETGNPWLVLLDMCTGMPCYEAIGLSTEAARSTVTAIMRRLATGKQCSTLEAMRRTVLRQHHANPHDDRVSQVVARIAGQTLQDIEGFSDVYSPALLREAVSKLLTTPGAMGSALLKPWHQADRFWISVMASLSSESDAATSAESLSWSERAIAAGNVLELIAKSATRNVSMMKSGLRALDFLMTIAHVEWAFGVNQAVAAAEAEQQEDYDMEDDDTQMPQVWNGFQQTMNSEDTALRESIASLAPYEATIKKQWEYLYDTTIVRHCLSTLDDPYVRYALCKLYALFLMALGRAPVLGLRQSFQPPAHAISSFLSAVSVDYGDGTSIISSLWSALRTCDVNHRPLEDRELPLLLVFNAVFSYTLLALDDETLYDRPWQLNRDDLVAVVAFLKAFIYSTCWHGSTSASTTQTHARVRFATLTTAVKLFNLLYDRDCRRPFTTEGAWLWPTALALEDAVDLNSMDGELDEAHALASLLQPEMSLSPQERTSFLLTTIPQVFSFQDRIKLFENLLAQEKQRLSPLRDEFMHALHVRVKRDTIVQDSFAIFHQITRGQSPTALKARIKVTFVNAQGLEEAGIDGGGVFKEYVDELTKHAFSTEWSLFTATPEQLLYPNPGALYHDELDSPADVYEKFRFLGRVLGKAVYENILVEPQFAAFFLNKLLGKVNYIDDLQSLDPELYRHIMQLKHYDGQVEDLALTFSVTEMEHGRAVTHDLVPGGSRLAVTRKNRIRYIHMLAHYKLNVQSARESAAFLHGFRDLIPAKWIQMFSPHELQMLIGGTATPIDVADWQSHTLYGGGYHPSQPPIQWFWDVVAHELSREDQALLLKFITSCSRPPLLGFQQLAPAICIHQVRIDDDERLPSSATCMNLLKLPTYSSKEILRAKLLYAIHAGAGFDLS